MSEEAKPASTELTATDARGRKIALRVLDPGDTLDLLEAAGPASGNEGYMRYAMVINSVSAIDDVPLPLPSNRSQLKANAKTLGNDGFAAAAMVLFGSAIGNQRAGVDTDTAKN